MLAFGQREAKAISAAILFVMSSVSGPTER
jgi:hypothetical protein